MALAATGNMSERNLKHVSTESSHDFMVIELSTKSFRCLPLSNNMSSPYKSLFWPEINSNFVVITAHLGGTFLF